MAMGISHTSVQRIWREAGLKPHLTARFKVSSDPQFEEKVTDIVGLYMSPPDKALAEPSISQKTALFWSETRISGSSLGRAEARWWSGFVFATARGVPDFAKRNEPLPALVPKRSAHTAEALEQRQSPDGCELWLIP